MFPSSQYNSHTFDLKETGLSKKKWNALTLDQQMEKVKELCAQLEDRPYWVAFAFNEKT